MKDAILIVEDDDAVRPSLVRFIQREGLWSIVAVASATDARAALKSSPGLRWIGFVVDLGLPEGAGAGLELLADLRAQCPHVPAAVVTGLLDRRVANRVAALDASYLLKPPSTEELAPFVARVVDRVSALDRVERLATAAAARFSLTAREREVLACVLRGDSVPAFCAGAGISRRTFHAHSASVRAKTGTSSLHELAILLLREGLDPHAAG